MIKKLELNKFSRKMRDTFFAGKRILKKVIRLKIIIAFVIHEVIIPDPNGGQAPARFGVCTTQSAVRNKLLL